MVAASASIPELSVIIPTLNEEAHLPLLLHDLLRQQDLDCEVLISDGGSQDQTCLLAAEVLAGGHVPYLVLIGPPGRGRQLNRAVRRARGEWLLFLHADCRLRDSDALLRGLSLLKQANANGPLCRTAAHFTLKFERDEAGDSSGLFFCEAKARLNEPGCTHGDQGFLLERFFFDEVGPFREDIPVMEDTWLAETIRKAGRWVLLPVEIETSPRRFRSEGFVERQILNALLMNFLFAGWDDFLHKVPAIYRQQCHAGPLQLLPFWKEIKHMLAEMPLKSRFRFWFATGRYVRSQVWQLAYLRETRRCFVKGVPIDQADHGAIRRFRAWFEPLTCNPFGTTLTGLLTCCWFYSVYLRLRRQRA